MRRLSARRLGILAAIFGAKPQKSIIQIVAEELSVTIEVVGPTSVLICASSRDALLAAEWALNRRLS